MKPILLWMAACLVAATTASAQAPAAPTGPAQLRVTVVDQTGAVLPTATVRVTPVPANAAAATAAPASVEAGLDDRGVASLQDLPIGSVQLYVESEGFAPVDRTITLRRGANTQTVALAVAGLLEQVTVTDTSATDDRRGNSQTVTLDEDDIAQLSDDPDELADQLSQMTGGAGATFMVDGFRGGRLPPRDQIRQIRFRMNSFSADNHDAGRVMVEIITKPGMNGWNGNANFGFRNDAMNARNAFSPTQTPEQLRRFSTGFRGPLVKGRTSLRVNVDGNRSFDSATILAQTPTNRISDVIRRPIDQTSVTVGVEHGLSNKQTLRLEFRNTDGSNRNQGVGNFSLPERAFTSDRAEQQLRVTLQSTIGRGALNQLHLQVNRQDNSQVADSSAPSIIVQDAFSSGGAGVSNSTLNKTWDLYDDFDFTVKKHAMRVGTWLSGGNFQQADARNANGTFTFGSLQAFLAGLPTTYTQRLGTANTNFSMYQLGVYWQDDFRVNRNLTMSLGVRQEMQSHLNDWFNVMPRFGFTWNPFGWKTALRGGYGIFHDWYDTNLYDQTLRVNGITQSDLLILNPGYPDPRAGAAPVVLPSGRVQASPDLRLPYVHQASIGAERTLFPNFQVQASLALQRGFDQLRSVNINAPDANGIRPEPTVGNVTQIESTGKSSSTRLTLGFNYRIPKYRLFINSNYTLASVKNYADNALALPANSLDPNAEWGPSAQDVRHRLNTMVNVPLPWALRASVQAQASSATPYTITTGRDDNHDGVTNDRPVGVGRNSARGDGRVELSFRLSRGFGFGTATGGGPGGRGGAGGGGAAAAQGPGGGGGPVIIQGGPGGGPGGPGGGGPGGFFGGGQVNRRYNVDFYLQAFNVLNTTNFQNFSGNLLSPFYGLPTSALQARRLEVGMQFRF